MSRFTAEAEVISLDTGARVEGLPALLLWHLAVEVFGPIKKTNYSNLVPWSESYCIEGVSIFLGQSILLPLVCQLLMEMESLHYY